MRNFFRQFSRDQVPEEYYSYLRKEITRDELFEKYPSEGEAAKEEAWHAELGSESLSECEIDKRIKKALGGSRRWVLIGGPPCQAYSTAGRSRNKGKKGYLPENDNRHKLVGVQKSLLLEITPPHYGASGIPRPQTPIVSSSLFTGSPMEPQLVHELLEEMRSADSVDLLISFVKWSGLRLLMPGFEDLRDRNVPVRVITTSYMGASDAPAVEWLATLPNVKVRISYDTQRTRLHAKAYHFTRLSGFSTAYIGSANMSHVAMTSGLEWNLKVTAQDMGHILEKFTAEFETYWNSREFIPYDPSDPTPLRNASYL